MISYAPPETDPLPILYHDDHILVLDKPSGLLSVPGRLEEHKDCLITRVQKERPKALVVHRLDMETSGLMVMAMSSEAQRNLSTQFEKRRIGKTYEALIDGCPDEQCGVIDLPLIKDWPNRPKQMVDHEKGKPSQTEWAVMSDEEGNKTRVRLTPLTGRTHQLRVHMAAVGHPILGDTLYEGERPGIERLCLHATHLSFAHPASAERATFFSAAPF